MTVYGDVECNNVYAMHRKFGFPTEQEPQLLEPDIMNDRYTHLAEELEEMREAFLNSNLAEVADALVDMTVLIKGTAVMMGLPWNALWREVDRANMSKVVGTNAHRPDQEYDLIKPSGWVPPRIELILDGDL